MTPIIRDAQRAEAERLTEIALRAKSYWGYTDDFMRACRAELTVTEDAIQSNEFVYRVAELNGHVVGFYALDMRYNDTVELDALFVQPELMRKGIGSRLLDDAMTKANTLGYRSLMFESEPNAEQFYLEAGAKKIGMRESGSIIGRYLSVFEFDTYVSN